jgi:hypothetical protein
MTTNVFLFRDKEAFYFYVLEISLVSVVGLVALVMQIWLVLIIMLLGIAGFLIFGPPTKAEINTDGTLRFIGPLWRTKITPESLIRVKAQGVRDYRAHVELRNKYSLGIMYRCRKYEHAA